jgi:hypothetical protein
VGGPLALARDLTSSGIFALQKRMVCYFYWDLRYEKLGHLIREDQEVISNIVLRNDAKISRTTGSSGTTSKTIEFGYTVPASASPKKNSIN